jgi:hypothetical protein
VLKFTIDMIERSSGGNAGDFRNRGCSRLEGMRAVASQTSERKTHKEF